MTSSIIRPDRRQLIKGIGTAALVAGLGTPYVARAQSETVKIGHLTPLTGFLGPLGEYAQLGVQLAVEEINAAGGVNGKQIEAPHGGQRQSGHGIHQGRTLHQA
ncbi:ABC transporter substrate-binding protein [Jiella pelagia]|uniref:ABC transporter substrate-binding protein n=1 Tax=Jiella pelagia TaxID=2986949 RepID=UPI002E32D064|nr:ABC transporter substrate-binding protein [Jiella pelagia]